MQLNKNFPSDFDFGLRHVSATSEQSSEFTICPNSIQYNSILIYQSAGLTAQKPIIKLAPNNYNTNFTSKHMHKQHNTTSTKFGFMT